ncbi:MAG: hypothetical protein UR23_C0044G0006 [Candidatus Roizmanbacteria bacterium GW2011_GWA2_32_13]|uniref:GIY-YIG domain-containing protein n=1 Tax=Candidatus Roizmanbacteria bacterium GW2011_GWA2_32_13 TaxID=1618475 RepID=A0A0F9YPV0_9BACT|nr:MAG: hypothetical protein UR23_C0044G0006 [Candidatus Roizmanbacteria bacterium GW2011_GWA2_32_13]
MFYVYVLKNKKNGDLYVGQNENLRKRFEDHNKGKVKSTKNFVPWILIYYEAYRDKRDATKRERNLKRT